MHYGELIWTEIAAHRHKVVVVPIGSLEQHGHHLPLLTDTMIGGEVARRAEAVLGEQALFLPPLWVGASDHHRGFPGTISLRTDTYMRVLDDILESVIAAGFRRIVLLNAHGGNEVPGFNAIYEVQLRHQKALPDLWIAFASWMDLAREQIAAIPTLTQKQVTHACELETSVILALRPELVRLEAARGTVIASDSQFYVPDFSRASRVYVPRAFDQISETGAFGDPSRATVESGAAIIAVAVEQFVAFVEEFASWQPITPA